MILKRNCNKKSLKRISKKDPLSNQFVGLDYKIRKENFLTKD